MSIHPSAIIDPLAKIHPDTNVGPFCIIGPDVEIGAGCDLSTRISIHGRVRIGNNNILRPTCVIGGPPQDINSPAAPDGRIEIGDHNSIAEAVTIHLPKMPHGITRVGSHNRLDFGSHVAHDAHIGDHVRLGKLSLLAGHSYVDDHAYLQAPSVVHQFATVGRYCLTEPYSGIRVDAPPFMKILGFQGDTATSTRTTSLMVQGINREELVRQEFPETTIASLEEAYKIVWQSGSTRPESIGQLEKSDVPEMRELARFLRRSMQGRLGRALEAKKSG
jgi:UDP-N-acetylglucosamine acyltransferase